MRAIDQASLGVTLLFLSVGCGDTPGDGTPGELGDGTFDYHCENDGDLKCSETDAVDEFEVGADLGRGDALPLAVAVGSTFGIRYAGSARAGEDGVLVSVDAVSAKDRRGPNVYRIQQPAEAAIVATDSDGKVVDFTVITALEATELSVWNDQEEETHLALEVGENLAVTVAPRSESGTLLAGALPYDWWVEDLDVASIGALDEGAEEREVKNEGDIEISGVSAGKTTLRVRSGDLEAALEVEVRP